MIDSGTEYLRRRHECPVCGSTSTISLLRHPYDATPIREFLISHYENRADLTRLAGAIFDVDRCNNCSLVFQRNVPTDSLLQEIYDIWIPSSEEERLHQRYGLADYRYFAGQVEFLIQHLRLKPFQIGVFDFGLGWGEWASVARSYGCKVAGFELSTERIDHARAIGITMLDWDDIPNQKFHYINAEQVFEHVIEPRATLRHLARALHNNGLVKISVPDGRRIAARLKGLANLPTVARDRIMPIQPLEHVNCFDYGSLVELGRQAGLKVVRPSLRLLYNGSSGWLEPRQGLKNLVRPIYRHIYPKSTFAYFTRTGS